MMTIPHLDKLKRNKVRIYLFGYGDDPWASPLPKEVYRAGVYNLTCVKCFSGFCFSFSAC
jgi:hypothetical protein